MVPNFSAPLPIKSNFLFVVSLITCLCSNCLTSPGWAIFSVQVIFSGEDGSHQLTNQPAIEWERQHTTSSTANIEIDLSQRRQSILGLGASLEHATCENLWKLAPDLRETVMERLVSPEKGLGMNLMRICIGTSDFVGEPYYTYNDLPSGETDIELSQFSIEKDRAYVLPAIKMAMKINPDLLLFASPWSPPAWMKDSQELGGGSVLAEYYSAYAHYLLKFIQAYEAEGIPIYAITVQNEPQHTDRRYPTTRWTAEEQKVFIRDHLGPLLNSHQIKTQIWCWDHNWNLIEFPRLILSDPEASAFVDGIAFHHYEGKVEAQSVLHDEFPDTPIYFTEGSVFRTRGAVRLIEIFRNWSRSFNAWVIMLDERRQPNRGPHSASATCIELLDDNTVRYNFDYFMQGQFMKYIKRGAVCVDSTKPEIPNFSNVSFVNPDGETVLVAANAGRDNISFGVSIGERYFSTELPARTVGTYLIPGLVNP